MVGRFPRSTPTHRAGFISERFEMPLIAAKEPGGTEGYSWEKAGDEGAIEVPIRLAHSLLSIPGELFYQVQKEVKKIEKTVENVVEKEVEKVAPKVVPKSAEEDPTSPDITSALDAASTTKRRAKKE